MTHEEWNRFRYKYLKKEGTGNLKQAALTEKRKEVFIKVDQDGAIKCDWILWNGEGYHGSDPPYTDMKVPNLSTQEEDEWY